MEPDNGLLDKYILNLVPKEHPKICFMGTASNDGTEYREMFYKFFNQQQCEPTHLSFIDPPDNIAKFISEQDIIHVGGGNTKLIMETWKKSGVDKIMRKAWQDGVILSGMSAGAICWFEDGITNPSPGVLTRLECLGLLHGSFCPHYDDRAELKAAFHKLILDGIIKEGFGVEDGAAVHFIGLHPVKVITSRPGVSAYKVKKFRNKIIETRMEPVYLGKESEVSSLKNGNGNSREMEVLKTAVKFIDAINDQDVDEIVEMMSDDHRFIDSMGMVIKGRKEMKKAWEAFFEWFPDYEIRVMNTVMTDDTVGFYGIASGTYDSDEISDKDKFEIPAAWRAKVKDNLITEWQVFADNQIVRDILDENGRRRFFKEHMEKLLKKNN